MRVLCARVTSVGSDAVMVLGMDPRVTVEGVPLDAQRGGLEVAEHAQHCLLLITALDCTGLGNGPTAALPRSPTFLLLE